MKENPTITLERYIRARYPVILVLSHEESRVMRSIAEIAAKKRTVVEWSDTRGMTGISGLAASDYEDPNAALKYIAQFDEEGSEEPVLFVVKDLHDILKLDLTGPGDRRDSLPR